MARRFRRNYENHIGGAQELKMSKNWDWNMEIKQERKMNDIKEEKNLEMTAERNANR